MLSESIGGDGGVDFAGPGEDAAAEVFHLGESGMEELIDGLGAASAAFAVDDDGEVAGEFVESVGELV